MSRYIDADALDNLYTATHGELIFAIEEAPTADVVDRNECSKCVLYPFKQLREKLETDMVEVVRCKDCKWKQGSECVRFADIRPFGDDFCSRGERREDEQ